MLIWDKYDKTYREVIDVNIIKEKIEEQYERDWIFNEVRDEVIEVLQELLED